MASLREWRKIRGLGQEDLAQALGVHVATISAYELGKVQVPHEKRQKLRDMGYDGAFEADGQRPGITLRDLTTSLSQEELAQPLTKADGLRIEARIARSEREIKTFLEALAAMIRDLEIERKSPPG